MVNNAQKSVSFITSKQRFSQKLYSLAEEFKEAAAKGVTIRFLMERSEAEKHRGLADKLAKSYKETTFEVKYTRDHPPVVMAVFDKKEVLVIASATAGLKESSALWSNNPGLVELAHNYFEMTWLTAFESTKPE
jgi:sugar-specific transcriptional regulator TrmB